MTPRHRGRSSPTSLVLYKVQWWKQLHNKVIGDKISEHCRNTVAWLKGDGIITVSFI